MRAQKLMKLCTLRYGNKLYFMIESSLKLTLYKRVIKKFKNFKDLFQSVTRKGSNDGSKGITSLAIYSPTNIKYQKMVSFNEMGFNHLRKITRKILECLENKFFNHKIHFI